MNASDHITSAKASQVVVAYRRLYVSGSLSRPKPIPHVEALWAPDLTAETASPNQSPRSLAVKARPYLRADTRPA